MRHLLPGGSLMSSDVRSGPSSLSLSSAELLFRYQRSLAELLRHFWACFPVINQQLEQKAGFFDPPPPPPAHLNSNSGLGFNGDP